MQSQAQPNSQNDRSGFSGGHALRRNRLIIKLAQLARATLFASSCLMVSLAASLAYPSPASAATAGYWLLSQNGTVYNFGAAANYGSSVFTSSTGYFVSLVPAPDGKGYWTVTSAAQIQAFGDAPSLSITQMPAGGIVVGAAGTADGKGLWFVTDRGEVGLAGDATTYGNSPPNLNGAIIGITRTADGKGYWLLGQDGGVFALGDAAFEGSAAGLPLAGPIVAIASTPTNMGYWLIGSDGGVFAFGDAGFYGSSYQVNPSLPPGGSNSIAPLAKPAVGVVATSDGKGYWVSAQDGGVFAFGDAGFVGSLGGSPPASPIRSFANE